MNGKEACRNRYYRLKASKICVHCGDAHARDNRITCEKCGRIASIRALQHHARKKLKDKRTV